MKHLAPVDRLTVLFIAAVLAMLAGQCVGSSFSMTRPAVPVDADGVGKSAPTTIPTASESTGGK